LVQTVYPLSEETALALTTAHFYTPSGRLIQRDYSHISFLDYYTSDRKEQKNLSDVKTTDAGRTVYGGGGITPDEKWVEPPPNALQFEILRKQALFDFSAAYFGARREIQLPLGWEPGDDIVNGFREFLIRNGSQFTDAEFAANRAWIQAQLKHEMYITAFGKSEADRVKIEQDPEVARAVASMPQAKALIDSAKKTVARRVAQ